MTQKLLFTMLSLLALTAAGQAPPRVPYSDQPTMSETTTKISDHVWEMTGLPNPYLENAMLEGHSPQTLN